MFSRVVTREDSDRTGEGHGDSAIRDWCSQLPCKLLIYKVADPGFPRAGGATHHKEGLSVTGNIMPSEFSNRRYSAFFSLTL
jgi:hypothetical protein